jgi:hypothetical protein
MVFTWWLRGRVPAGRIAGLRQGSKPFEPDGLALRYQLRPDLAVRLGYRVVEGRSDGPNVYSFSLTHLVGAGLEVGLW